MKQHLTLSQADKINLFVCYCKKSFALTAGQISTCFTKLLNFKLAVIRGITISRLLVVISEFRNISKFIGS